MSDVHLSPSPLSHVPRRGPPAYKLNLALCSSESTVRVNLFGSDGSSISVVGPGCRFYRGTGVDGLLRFNYEGYVHFFLIHEYNCSSNLIVFSPISTLAVVGSSSVVAGGTHIAVLVLKFVVSFDVQCFLSLGPSVPQI